jgi:hypothetical protein
MSEIRELAETLAAFSGASGVGLAPTARAALSAFWHRDVTRNAMREVEQELLRVRPAPGDSESMREIARQLRLQLVDPTFLAVVEDVVEHGHFRGMPTIVAHLTAQLALPDGTDRDRVVELIADTLLRHAGRAQKDDRAAIDVAVGLHTDRAIGAIGQAVTEQLGPVAAHLDRLAQKLDGPRLVVLDDHPAWARKTMRALAHEDPDGFEWLIEQLGDPPDRARIQRLIAHWPDHLSDASTHVLFALVRQAEAHGLWSAASRAWERLAERYTGERAADHLARAAVDAGVAADDDRRLVLLERARAAHPESVRVRLEELDQAAEPAQQLRELAGLSTDDAPLGALLECHRAMVHLLAGDLAAAREHLRAATELEPDAVAVRSLAIDIVVQEARLALRSDQAYPLAALQDVQRRALALREELLEYGRDEEAMRLLMLAAEVDGLLFDANAMAGRLRDVSDAELRAREAAEVLGDAALRAGDDRYALELLDRIHPADTESVRRIRATAVTQTGTSDDRLAAVDELEQLALGGGPERTLAALARLQACSPPIRAAWSDEVAAVLVAEGYENVALGLHVRSLCARGRPIDAEKLLAGRPDEPWVAELRLVVAGVRGAHAPLREAAETFLRHAPHAPGRLLAARGLAESRALPEARDVLIALAHDHSAAPRVRADAFDLLMQVCADLDDWQVAERSLIAWQRFVNHELRAIDPRISQWQPRVAARRSRPPSTQS